MLRRPPFGGAAGGRSGDFFALLVFPGYTHQLSPPVRTLFMATLSRDLKRGVHRQPSMVVSRKLQITESTRSSACSRSKDAGGALDTSSPAIDSEVYSAMESSDRGTPD